MIKEYAPAIVDFEYSFMRKRTLYILSAIVALLVALTILQDSLYAAFYTTSFYFSESFLFTSFWWIFIPLLYAQYSFVRPGSIKSIAFAAVVVLPMLLHFILFPAFVWLASALFYEHTFRMEQTLRYGLSSYLYVVLTAYILPVSVFLYLHRTLSKPVLAPTVSVFPKTLLVTEGNRKMNIAVSDIHYLSANSPYINLHLGQKKYVHNETLKSIATQLSPDYFVRIHKSTIVNLEKVASYTSRFNGDYDLTLKDGTELRMSRNFVAEFKARYQPATRVGVQ